MTSLRGMVSIGRDPTNAIVVDEEGIAPHQACIFPRDGKWLVDGRGAMLYLNERPMNGTQALTAGDRILVGSARLTFLDDVAASPPTGSAPRGHGDRLGTAGNGDQRGTISFRCVCGVTLRSKSERAGRTGRCYRCGQKVTVPRASGGVAEVVRPAMIYVPPTTTERTMTIVPTAVRDTSSTPLNTEAEPIPALELVCSICQCGIEAGEEQTSCPNCRLPFHVDCWQENLGCSAYGCSQVNALRQGPDISLGDVPSQLPLQAGGRNSNRGADQSASPLHSSELPWEYVSLGASGVVFLFSLMSHGIPSMIATLVGLACVGSRLKSDRDVPSAMAAAVALSVLGGIVGLVVGVKK